MRRMAWLLLLGTVAAFPATAETAAEGLAPQQKLEQSKAAGDFEAALQAAQECLAREPDDAFCVHGRLFSLLHLKRYDEAISGSEEALAKLPLAPADPAQAEDHKELRRAISAIRRIAEADRCDDAVDVQIESFKAEDWPGVIRQAAIADSTCNAQDVVVRALVWSRAATAHENASDHAAMLDAADRCIAIDPLYIICHAERARALVHMRRYDDADRSLINGRGRISAAKARIEAERATLDRAAYDHRLKLVDIGAQSLEAAASQLKRAQELAQAKRIAIDAIGGSTRTSQFRLNDGTRVREVTFDGTEMLSAFSRSLQVVPLGSEGVDVVVQLDWYVEPTAYDDCRWTMLAVVRSRSGYLGEVMHSGWRPCGEIESRLARSSRLIAERILLARTEGRHALSDAPLEPDSDPESLNEYRIGVAQIEADVEAEYRERQRQREAEREQQRALFDAARNLAASIGGGGTGEHYAPSCFSDSNCPGAERCLKPSIGAWGRCGKPSKLNTAPGGYAKSCTTDSDCTGGRCLGADEPRVCGDY